MRIARLEGMNLLCILREIFGKLVWGMRHFKRPLLRPLLQVGRSRGSLP
jgi:hypothetical protein